MTDFFTLISLVLAVSGSSYAAIAGIHGWLGGRIKDRHERATFCKNKITEEGTHETKANGLKSHTSLCRCLFWWHTAYFLPCILFLIFSFFTAAHVSIDYYFGEPPESGQPSVPTAGPIYMHFLTAITVIDFLCIVVTFVSYGVTGLATSRLESGLRQVDEMLKLKAASPNTSTALVPLRPEPPTA